MVVNCEWDLKEYVGEALGECPDSRKCWLYTVCGWQGKYSRVEALYILGSAIQKNRLSPLIRFQSWLVCLRRCHNKPMVTAVLNVTVYSRSPIPLTVIIGGSYVPIHVTWWERRKKYFFFTLLVHRFIFLITLIYRTTMIWWDRSNHEVHADGRHSSRDNWKTCRILERGTIFFINLPRETKSLWHN